MKMESAMLCKVPTPSRNARTFPSERKVIKASSLNSGVLLANILEKMAKYK
jgi:hypothetical protein